MSIGNQIETIVASMTGNNNPPQIVTIRKAYNNNTADITTKDGVLKNVRCSGTATNGDKAILLFENGDIQSPFVLLFTAGEVDIVNEWETILSTGKVPSEKLVKETLDTKQATLISGTNIKTINNNSLLGSGNINISGGGSADIVTEWETTLSDEKVPSEKLTKNSLDDKVNRSELYNLDINLTTLELVPYSENPNGVICFEDLGRKYIEKSNTSGLMKNDGTVDTNTYATQSSLNDYIHVSNTSGLVKNDGSIDTTQYLSSLPSHNHDDRYYTETEMDTRLSAKQATLVSGTNIKTINNESLLGSGNITIQGGGGSVIGTGSFSINSNGHLIVELPNGVDNPYFINNQGHLIYDTSNTHNNGD